MTLARCRRDVDAVEADAGSTDHRERGAGSQHLCRHLRGGADDQRVRARHRLEQLLGAQAFLHVDRVARLGQEVEPALRDLLRYQYPCHRGGLLTPPAD
jgi:hypothetical protein